MIEVISVGFDETCVLKINGEERTYTADEVQDMSNLLLDVCYTMGFKSDSSPEKHEGAKNSGFFGRLVD